MQKEKVASPLETELMSRVDSAARMAQILESLDDNDRKAVEAVLEKMKAKNADKSTRGSHLYSYQWLAETLTKHGHPVTKGQIRHYLKRQRKAKS